MLPSVDFVGSSVTRLIIGANPFGGYSHQNPGARPRDARLLYARADYRDLGAGLGGGDQYHDHQQ